MLGHLQHQSALTAGHFQRIENGRQALIELDIHHSTNHSHYAAVGQRCLSSWGSITPAWKDIGIEMTGAFNGDVLPQT